MPGGQLLQLDVPNAGDRIGLDDQFIPVGRGGADIGLGIELVPGAQPRGYRVFFAAAHIQALTFLQGFFQLFLDFGLCLTQHILDNPLAGLGVVPGGVPALPAAIFSLTDVTFAVGPLFCHGRNLPPLVS